MPPTLQGPHSRSQRSVETRWKNLCNSKDELLTHSQCAQMGIHVTRLELETTRPALESGPTSGFTSGSSSGPREVNIPIAGSYFEPLTDEFMLDYPVDEVRLREDLREEPQYLVMRDYNPEAAEAEAMDPTFRMKHWGPKQCLSKVVTVFKRHVHHVRRIPRGSRGPAHSLIDLSRWVIVNNKVTLGQAFYLPWPNFRDSDHPIRMFFEVENYIFPHVTMVVQHNTDVIVGNEHIMRHELAYILNVMRIRLAEGLFHKKQPQPVLMVSFVAPQHGRILEAYIKDQTKIEIACSRLYSFEKNETAPFELFYRWLVSEPIHVEPSEPRPQPDDL